MTEAELDEINEKISSLFEGKTLDEVSTILTIQLGMLVMQGTESAEEASEFLDDITEQVEDMIGTYDFSADANQA